MSFSRMGAYIKKAGEKAATTTRQLQASAGGQILEPVLTETVLSVEVEESVRPNFTASNPSGM